MIYGQVPLALLEFCNSVDVSLTARVAAMSALHVIRSDFEARTIHQLEKYLGPCAYEKVGVQLVLSCVDACEASALKNEDPFARPAAILLT